MCVYCVCSGVNGRTTDMNIMIESLRVLFYFVRAVIKTRGCVSEGVGDWGGPRLALRP